MATKTVKFEIKRQASPDAPAVWENFELEWRHGHERHLRHDGDRRQSRHRRRQAHHAHHLRLQLPRGDLRLLRHAHQRQGAHGLLRAGRQSRAAHQGRAALQVPAGPRPPGRPLRAVRKPHARQGMGSRRRHIRSRLRPARLPAAAGSELPALQLHLLHLLHGGLPAVQRSTPASSAPPPSPR